MKIITYLAGASTPEVNTTAQAHGQDILRGPVHQIQIEVVLQLWGIQNLERYPGDLAGGLPRWSEQLLAFGANWRQGVRTLAIIVLQRNKDNGKYLVIIL